MSHYDEYESRSRQKTIRRMRRLSEPHAAYFPWHVIFPLGILGLSIFSCAHIQEQTEAAAERALTGAEIAWAEADASGRTIILSGEAPSAKARLRAERIVENTDTGTWLGSRLVPAPVKVENNLTLTKAPVVNTDTSTGNDTANSDPRVSQPAPTLSRPPSPTTDTGALMPDWTFRYSGGVLRLEGEVPNEATRSRIVQFAQASVPPGAEPIEDNLTVRDIDAPEGYVDVAERGIRTVIACDRGMSSFRGERFFLTCELPESAEARVRADAAAPLAFGSLGTITMQPNERITACEQSLAALLSNTKIQFASNSAAIDESSAELITSIAEAANACPYTLRVEGHTDSTGSAEKNDDLSARRAAAVRRALIDNGVPAERLVSQGFGSRRPIARNNTSDGRARNRRIEIKVVRLDE